MNNERHTKNSIILQVYEYSNFQQKDVRLIVDLFLKTLTDAIKKGETVEIRGLGVFSFEKKEERKRFNFQEKKVVKEKQGKVIVFTPSKSLKLALNGKTAKLAKVSKNLVESEQKK